MKTLSLLFFIFFSHMALALEAGYYTCELTDEKGRPYSYNLVVGRDGIVISRPELDDQAYRMGLEDDNQRRLRLTGNDTMIGITEKRYKLYPIEEAVYILELQIDYANFGTHFSDTTIIQMEAGTIALEQVYRSSQNDEGTYSLSMCRASGM